ncbi:MAG TPA: tripartite tricarboxylate transporter substrate binding protein [Xanthobacteraceae bacterium]|nr:tripartite tricarboxylate transporter substrate binding protein [Xanthobacteraceae bacterium]
MHKVLGCAAALVAMFGASTMATGAADYPNRPITLVLGFAPGGPSDVLARIVSRKMEQSLGQPVVIDNRPGASGAVASQAVARAAPDGYTLLLASSSMLSINPQMYNNLGYDPVKDFQPISILGTQPSVIYVNPKFEAKSLAELIAYAKSNPGKLNFATGGKATPQHLAGELLALKAGIKITHVPYKGTGPALQDVIAGHVPVGISAAAPVVSNVKGGNIRPLAVTTAARTAILPDVPSVAEQGFPGFDANAWHSIVAPARTPPDVVKKLHGAIVGALTDPSTRKQLEELGLDVVGNTPEEFRATLLADLPRWAEIIKASGAQGH